MNPSTPSDYGQLPDDKPETPQPTKKKAEKKTTLPRTKKPRKNPAADILRAKEKQRVEALREEKDRLNEENLFYLRCSRHVDHHGMYLTEHPEGMHIHPGMWFSILHRAGEQWIEPRVACQECYLNGEKYVWLWLKPNRMPDGQVAFTMTTPPRTTGIYSISREDLELRLGSTIEEMLWTEEEVTNAAG